RRDIDDVSLIPQLTGERQSEQPVQTGEECRQRLSRSGRRRDESILARLNGRPAEALRLRRLAETTLKPSANQRMKILKRHGLVFHIAHSACDDLVLQKQRISGRVNCLQGHPYTIRNITTACKLPADHLKIGDALTHQYPPA